MAGSSPPAAEPAAPALGWSIRGRTLSLRRPLLMGVVNLTPDSFSDGGRYLDPERALGHAERLVAEGASLLDLGGESTRPGARAVPAEEELARVLPALRRIRSRLDVPVSVDTRKAAVARAALAEGAEVINDVSALSDPEMAGVVAEAGAGVVLMHMRGTPQTMQHDPVYGDVVREVAEQLAEASARAQRAGIAPERIALDPGIGFGKTAEHNLLLIQRLDHLAALRHPVVLGVSRKAFIGAALDGAPPERRAAGTAGACVVGLLRGARIFRVHDVREVADALRVADAIRAGALAAP